MTHFSKKIFLSVGFALTFAACGGVKVKKPPTGTDTSKAGATDKEKEEKEKKEKEKGKGKDSLSAAFHTVVGYDKNLTVQLVKKSVNAASATETHFAMLKDGKPVDVATAFGADAKLVLEATFVATEEKKDSSAVLGELKVDATKNRLVLAADGKSTPIASKVIPMIKKNEQTKLEAANNPKTLDIVMPGQIIFVNAEVADLDLGKDVLNKNIDMVQGKPGKVPFAVIKPEAPGSTIVDIKAPTCDMIVRKAGAEGADAVFEIKADSKAVDLGSEANKEKFSKIAVGAYEMMIGCHGKSSLKGFDGVEKPVAVEMSSYFATPFKLNVTAATAPDDAETLPKNEAPKSNNVDEHKDGDGHKH